MESLPTFFICHLLTAYKHTLEGRPHTSCCTDPNTKLQSGEIIIISLPLCLEVRGFSSPAVKGPQGFFSLVALLCVIYLLNWEEEFNTFILINTLEHIVGTGIRSNRTH